MRFGMVKVPIVGKSHTPLYFLFNEPTAILILKPLKPRSQASLYTRTSTYNDRQMKRNQNPQPPVSNSRKLFRGNVKLLGKSLGFRPTDASHFSRRLKALDLLEDPPQACKKTPKDHFQKNKPKRGVPWLSPEKKG